MESLWRKCVVYSHFEKNKQKKNKDLDNFPQGVFSEQLLYISIKGGNKQRRHFWEINI